MSKPTKLIIVYVCMFPSTGKVNAITTLYDM